MNRMMTQWLYSSMLLFLFALQMLLFGGCTLLPTSAENGESGGAAAPSSESVSSVESSPTFDNAVATVSEMPIEEILNRIMTAYQTQPFHARIKLRHIMAHSPQYSQLPEFDIEYMIEYWHDGNGNFRRADLFGFSSLQTEVTSCYDGLCSAYTPLTNLYDANHKTIPMGKMDRDNSFFASSIGSAFIFMLKPSDIEEYEILGETALIADRNAVGITITSKAGPFPFGKVTYWIDPERWMVLATEPDIIGMDSTPTVFLDETTFIDYTPTFSSDFWAAPSNVQTRVSCSGNKTDVNAITSLASVHIPEVYELASVGKLGCLEPSGGSVGATYYYSKDGWAYSGMIEIRLNNYPVPIPDVGEIINVRGQAGRLIDSQEGELMLMWLENEQRFMIRGTVGRGGLTAESLLEIAESLEVQE